MEHEHDTFCGGGILFEVSDTCLVDADADCDVMGVGGVDDSYDVFGIFYIAGVEADFGSAGFDGFDCAGAAEMYVGNQGDSYFLDNFCEGGCVGGGRDGDSDEPTAGIDEPVYLPDASVDVGCSDFGHRLNDDGGSGADFDRTDVDCSGFSSLYHRGIVACHIAPGKLKCRCYKVQGASGVRR